MGVGEDIRFLLNDTDVSTDAPGGGLLLDFLRGEASLKGVKIGCREGDCGACTVLAGAMVDDQLVYRNVNSCLMPLANAAGKHIVTVEGLRLDGPNVIQEALMSEGATQCGFCTPGFVVSLAGYCLSESATGDSLDPADAMGGNICRCTGYNSILRAASQIREHLRGHGGGDPSSLIAGSVIPPYFEGIAERLRALPDEGPPAGAPSTLVGGGTDLYVQRPDELAGGSKSLTFLSDRSELRSIEVRAGSCSIGASVTMSEVEECAELRGMFPRLPEFLRLIASQAIRNQATIAGNLANASPIGDMTVFLLAQQSTLVLRSESATRRLPLEEFYRGYRDTDLAAGEWIECIEFAVPSDTTVFNFEKVSKRRELDIASVNSALRCELAGDPAAPTITAASCAVGGVAPVPLYLEATSAFLVGQPWTALTARAAAVIADGEIAPISDVRGSSDYKRLLCRQLMFAHFLSHPAGLVPAGDLA